MYSRRIDKGSFVVALQAKDGTVEIYGMVNGLTTGDYEYNIQGGRWRNCYCVIFARGCAGE